MAFNSGLVSFRPCGRGPEKNKIKKTKHLRSGDYYTIYVIDIFISHHTSSIFPLTQIQSML